MRRASKIFLHLTGILIPFFFAACGMPSTADGLQARSGTSSKKSTTKKPNTTTSTQTNTGTQTSTGTYNPNPTTTTSQPQQTCTTAQSKVSNLYNACINTLYDNDDVPGVASCLSAFSQLGGSSDCGSLSSKLNYAFSACRTMFTQYSSYLPTGCRSAIAAFGG